jgi:hypothetical protein
MIIVIVRYQILILVIGGCGGSAWAARARESGGCSVRVSPGKEDEHVI